MDRSLGRAPWILGAGRLKELKESLFKSEQLNFLTAPLNSLLASLQKILFCAAPLCLGSRESCVSAFRAHFSLFMQANLKYI